MKNVFCRCALCVIAVTALSIIAGCGGNSSQTGTEEAVATKVTAEPVKTSQLSANMDKSSGKTIPDSTSGLLSERKDLLKLSVKPEGSNSDENSLATDIVQRTQGALSANDAKIVTDGSGDVRISIRPKLAIVDQDGEYFRINCSVNVEIASADGKRIYGTNKVEVASPRRVLGKDAAIAGLAEPAADKIADWCRKELNRITGAEVGATVLSIQLPSVPEGTARNTMNDAANIKAIGDEIAKLPNLISYELVGQDSQKGICEYRVVYFISNYPNGIANEVSVRINNVKQK